METIERVLIVGLGLIGGSLSLAIKEEFPNVHITALDTDSLSLKQALADQVIDKIGTSFEEEAIKQDVIFLCTPVKQTEKFIQVLASLSFNRKVIVTDVGSTKSEIMQVSTVLNDTNVTFIGGHPMAGSHKSGYIASDIRLFENAYYILTPSNIKEKSKIHLLQNLLRGTKAKFLILDANEHDNITGMVSHLPHIIASGLVLQNELFTREHEDGRKLAAGGFRDITRIASSDPAMWTDILLSNQENLRKHLSQWKEQMEKIDKMLEQNKREEIYAFFKEAKDTRDQLPVHEPGAIPSFYDLLVQIPDYSGVIAEVTQYLAEDDISITNIKIIENRDDIFGTLQITFKSGKDREKGKECIEKKSNYTCCLI